MLRRFIFVFFPLLCCVLVQAQPGERGMHGKADTAGTGGNTYAIIIGISDYKLVPDLQFAHRDARSFEDFLISEAGGSVPRENIETFVNESATRNNVGDAISVIARKAKSGDRVWFFFAGHGDMEDLTQIENGLLLLHNSPHGNYFGMNDDVLEIIDLKRYLSPLSQRGVEMIFIVDACHSGNLNGGVQGVQQTATALASSWGREYKILSCQPNQLSLESAEWGGGRGLFSLQLEEAVKGLADSDGNGKITMFELQGYIQANVAKYSEYKQIPFITGDLSKSFFKVNPATLAALKKEKEQSYPHLASAGFKGSEDKYLDSLPSAGKKLFVSFTKNINEKKLVWPADSNALYDFKLFRQQFPENPLVSSMRRNLAAALNARFDSIVAPLLRGQTSYSTRDECYYAATELDSCLHLLGEQHYMYSNLKARKLYMEAMSYTWGLRETDYTSGWQPSVKEALRLLELSALLEPNASYTHMALGQHYYYLYDYQKANQAFEKYLELRPYDEYAKNALAIMYTRLGQHDKAEVLLRNQLQKTPSNSYIKLQLVDLYWNNNQPEKAMMLMDSMQQNELEKQDAYFLKGVYYSRQQMSDSAIYYYNEVKKLSGDMYCSFCDNNIGHMYFVTGQNDSARKYFLQILKEDSTNTYAHFNLGVISGQEGKAEDAFRSFMSAVQYANGMLEGFVTNLPLYFGKTYHHKDQPGFRQLMKKVYNYNMQYVSYLCMLYTYIRIPGLIDSTHHINYLFDLLFLYKPHEAQTWYHHASYLSLKKDKNAALQSLEKSLKLGYPGFFQIMNDADFDFLRTSPEWDQLLRTWFPEEMKRQGGNHHAHFSIPHFFLHSQGGNALFWLQSPALFFLASFSSSAY